MEETALIKKKSRAGPCMIQMFLRGAEAHDDGGKVTSDETNSTSDHFESLRAVKLRPD